jgi:O-antigen ligase
VVPLLVAWACGLLALLAAVTSQDPWAVMQESAPRAWVVAALLTALLGLLQWFGVAPQTTLVSAAQVGEAYGNLRQKNQFATLTAIGFAVLVFRPAPLVRPVAVGAVLLLAAGNALSASRTGLVEWLAITALAAAWPGARRERLSLCAVGIAGYVAAGALAPQLLWSSRGVEATNVFLRASTELGCSSRKVLWSNVLHLIAQKPWTGWGAGELDFAHYVTLYDGPRFCDILDNAHNLPLQIAVELGIPAAVLAAVVAGAIVWRVRPWAEAFPQRQLAWAVLAVIGVHSLLEYPLWYGPFQLAALVAVTLLLPAAGIARGTRVAIGAACVLVVVGLSQVAVAYDRVSDAYRPPQERRPALAADPVSSLGQPVLFSDQVRFARLSLMPVTRANAARVHALASEMLHYSPEPAVIEKLLDSALLLGRRDEVVLQAARYEAAFPDRFEGWRAAHGLPIGNGRQSARVPASPPAQR